MEAGGSWKSLCVDMIGMEVLLATVGRFENTRRCLEVKAAGGYHRSYINCLVTEANLTLGVRTIEDIV